MSKKYLSLEEAANLLNVPTSELMRMREQGEIRGFADRGNWKFKVDDVEAMVRVNSGDSNPEIPLFAEEDDESVGEQPTIISKGLSDDELNASILDDDDDADADDESDVLLVGGPSFDLDDSDSDVKLVGLDSAAEIPTDISDTAAEIDLSGSDSDVRLSADSDSDVRLIADDDGGSDSDVSLADSATITSFAASAGDSDSDISLISDENDESDVTLMSGDDQEAVPLDLSGDDISVFGDDESGISLSGDSSLMLGGESGISLEGPADSGMELIADEDDEGITLDLGDDSGISLEMDESGISLESDDMNNIIPMMDALDNDSVPETEFEIPSLEDDDDVFSMDADETGVLDMSDLDDSEADDGVFDLDEDDDEDEFAATGAFDDDDLDIEDDVFDDDEDLDVFDADDDVFDDEDSDVAYAGARGIATGDADWGTGTFVGLLVASLLMLVCGAVMIDLLNNMGTAAATNPLSSAILDALGGLYGG